MTRSARARSYVPAPPLTRAAGQGEGVEILAEVPGERGVVLWATLRDAMLFVSAPVGERGDLFPPGAGEARRREVAGAGLEPELWGPLLSVAAVMDDPVAARRARVAAACRAVARWAEGKAPATRLAFAQAAALARPADARLALSTARLARDQAETARAETWFRRAVKLARGRDWEAYVRAFLGLGLMYYRGGNYPAASAVARRALRAARRRRLRSLEGDANHDLFLIANDTGQPAAAQAHAQAALRAYGPGHPRTPHLVHDVGMFWAHQGCFDLAQRTLQEVLPCFADPLSRARVLANTVRAAAGNGDRAAYEESRARTLALLAEAPGASTIAAEMLMLVARGDNLAGRWDRAEEVARRAVELASARAELHTRLMAEAELECALARRGSRDTARAGTAAALAAGAVRLADEVSASLGERAHA